MFVGVLTILRGIFVNNVGIFYSTYVATLITLFCTFAIFVFSQSADKRFVSFVRLAVVVVRADNGSVLSKWPQEKRYEKIEIDDQMQPRAGLESGRIEYGKSYRRRGCTSFR